MIRQYRRYFLVEHVCSIAGCHVRTNHQCQCLFVPCGVSGFPRSTGLLFLRSQSGGNAGGIPGLGNQGKAQIMTLGDARSTRSNRELLSVQNSSSRVYVV